MPPARAFHLKLVFHDFDRQPKSLAEALLEKWCRWASRSRIPAMVDAARTIRRHWNGFSDGSPPGSPTLCWKASTVSFTLPKPEPAVIEPHAISLRWSIPSQVSANLMLPTYESEEPEL